MIHLREYQRVAIDKLRLSYKSGKRAPLLVSPTGTGKTCMLSFAACGQVARGGTVNWYAHRRELITQAADTLRKFGLEVGAFGVGLSHPVQVIGVQGALARGEVRECTMAAFDEAHHFASAAETWVTLLNAHRSAIILGATATPARGDGSALDGYDDIVTVAQVAELVDLWRRDPTQGLVPMTVLRPGHQLGKGRIAQLPVDAYIQHGAGRRMALFAPHVKAAEEFAQQFRDKGIPCGVVHGKTPTDERDDTLYRFARGDIKVVANVYVLTEGWDLPACDIVAIARPVGSAQMMLQMAGRARRPAPGKTECLLLDLRGVTHDPLIGGPDDDRIYSLHGEGMTRKGLTGPRMCGVCKRELGADEMVCGECGREVPELETPKATNDPLVKWAAKRRESVDQQVVQLVRWMRKFPDKKDGFYRHRFAAVYGNAPAPELIASARVMAGGRR